MKSKRENIAEYILFLWQMEDVVRTLSDNEETIAGNQFLTELRDMMHSEGVMEQGHTQIAIVAQQEMEELHTTLLDEEAVYRASFMQLLPQLNILKSRSDNPTQSDIQMMLVFLYNIMLLRLQKKDISAETLALQQQISRLLAGLSKRYRDEANV